MSKPPSHDEVLENTQVLRGGDQPIAAIGYSTYEMVSRWLVRSADAIQERMHAFGGNDPARPLKNGVGWAMAVVSLDQTGKDIAEGHYAKAVAHGFQAATIAATSVPAINDAAAQALTRFPATRAISTGIAEGMSYLNITKDVILDGVKVGSKELPLAGAVINLASGAAAAAARESRGDSKGAVGEMVVTGASVATYVAVLALTTVASAACGPFAPACAAVSLPMAATLAFGLSETVSEVTSRVYNHYNGTDIRGSAVVTLGKYAVNRLAPLVHKAGDAIESAGAHIAATTVAAVHSMGHAAQVAIEHPIATASALGSAALNAAKGFFGFGTAHAATPHHAPDPVNRVAQLNAIGKHFVIANNVAAQLEQHGFKPLMDKNGDKHIDMNEIKACIKGLKIDLTTVDVNHDGIASPSEVSRAINGALQKTRH